MCETKCDFCFCLTHFVIITSSSPIFTPEKMLPHENMKEVTLCSFHSFFESTHRVSLSHCFFFSSLSLFVKEDKNYVYKKACTAVLHAGMTAFLLFFGIGFVVLVVGGTFSGLNLKQCRPFK